MFFKKTRYHVNMKGRSMNKYHFILSINFKCDYDVEVQENIIKIKPYKIIKYEDSKDNEAKFIYKSEIMDNINTDDKFRVFVKQVYPKLRILKNVLKLRHIKRQF